MSLSFSISCWEDKFGRMRCCINSSCLLLFERKLITWLSPANLELHQITWVDPASLLEKIVAYEVAAVLDAFIDPYLVSLPALGFQISYCEPLTFIEVALMKNMACTIQEVLWHDPPTPECEATTALFYSISSTHVTLILFHNMMIGRLNWMADRSEKGFSQSGEIMVNYIYRFNLAKSQADLENPLAYACHRERSSENVLFLRIVKLHEVVSMDQQPDQNGSHQPAASSKHSSTIILLHISSSSKHTMVMAFCRLKKGKRGGFVEGETRFELQRVRWVSIHRGFDGVSIYKFKEVVHNHRLGSYSSASSLIFFIDGEPLHFPLCKSPDLVEKNRFVSMSTDLKLNVTINPDVKESDFNSSLEISPHGGKVNVVRRLIGGFLPRGKMLSATERRGTNERSRGNRVMSENDEINVHTGEKRAHETKVRSGPLVSGAAYCLSSCSMILLNKVVLSSYGFNAGISFLSVIILGLCGAVSLEKLSWKLVKIISAVTGGITDLSFDATGYTWQLVNCILTASYSLTLRRIMDTAKSVTKSGSLNEVSMVLLNNLISLPFGAFLIIIFDEWTYVINADVIKIPMFWVVATVSGLLGLAISFTSMWFICGNILREGQNVIMGVKYLLPVTF
ncbi:hypothetical protein L1987_21262 [Smallanthus sonchifolius]|uniref:Uncharacterized protein n=1 Tax=Smallanthus sonchifolius TaxID=185202 RepID=A0ACB9ITI4_9ASTR|nr:hypothetical protein L1987_21262 [Smallanthus sonchifolius]